MAKQVKYNVEARDALKRGVDILANAVKVTLGPKGRNVAIDKKYGPPHITKDGVTVAKEIELEDRHENLGAQAVKEVASKTASFDCNDNWANSSSYLLTMSLSTNGLTFSTFLFATSTSAWAILIAALAVITACSYCGFFILKSNWFFFTIAPSGTYIASR